MVLHDTALILPKTESFQGLDLQVHCLAESTEAGIGTPEIKQMQGRKNKERSVSGFGAYLLLSNKS